MTEYIGWSCEFSKNTGEGQLARKFINSYNHSKEIKIIIPKYNFLFSKYLYQFYGIFVLWYHYFLGKKIIYINYLPLWNFIIFLFCPPKTIFGPITGSVQINKIKNIKSLIRFTVFPTRGKKKKSWVKTCPRSTKQHDHSLFSHIYIYTYNY